MSSLDLLDRSLYRSLDFTFRCLPSAAALCFIEVGRYKRLYPLWTPLHARLFNGLSVRNMVGNLQTGSQKLSTKRFSSALNDWPRPSEQAIQNVCQSMSSLHTISPKVRHPAAALFHIIIFVQGTTGITAKLFPHCSRYGILLNLKCNVTITFPYSNGIGFPASFLISISIESKFFFCSGT